MIGNGVVVDPAVLFSELDALEARGVDTSRAGGQRQRAPDRALPPHDRQGDRAVPRQRPGSAPRPRHRPDVRRQDEPDRHPGPGPVRREDPAPEGRGRARACKNQLLVKVYNRRAITVDEVVEELLAYADRLRPMVADTALLLNQALDARQDRAARGRPGDAARRRPRHLPVRDLVATRPPAAPAPAPASRRPGSTG